MTVNTLPDDTHFFDWFRSQVPDRRLTQLNVDGAKELLEHTPPDRLMAVLISMGLASFPVLIIPNPKPPKATRNEIISAAKRINVDPAAIKALNDVESPKGGFYADGTPVILFERHKFYDALTKRNWYTKRDEMVEKYPDVCNESSGAYNVRPQHEKLEIAATLNWDAAHESASWGFGQVMGFNWQKLGYESIRDFVTRMYESEGQQLDAVCRYIKVTGLDAALRKHDWAAFSKGYNGKDYQRNDYDKKISTAYAKAKREGW